MNTNRRFHILVVDDSDADVELLKFLFENSGVACSLTFARDGQEGADIIFRRDEHGKAPRPDLILLDLNLPRKSGRELLREIKSDAQVHDVPVVIVTTSSNQAEVTECYLLGASAFITKPTDIEVYQSKINTLVAFWFGCVTLGTRFGRMPGELLL